MRLPTESLRKDIAKAKSDGARVQFGDVTGVTPVTVSFDGETDIPCYVSPGVQTVVGERVAVIKHGNAPGIILGISTDEPSGVTGDWIEAGTITAINIKAGTITAAQIAAHTITANEIKAGTLTATEIEAGSITTELLAAEAVTAGKIKAGTITATQIAASTITAGQIAAGTITATQIKAGTITTVELAANTIEAGDIKAGTITATEIASATITSGNIASGTITGSNIAGSTITASKITITELSALSADLGSITAGTVTGATLRTAASGKRVVIDSAGLHAYNAVEAVLDFDTTTGNLKIKGAVEAGSTIPASTITGQLTNAQLEAIAAAKITGTITGTQISENAVETGHIKADAITSAKILAGTIVSGDIAAGEIKATNIAASAIESSHIKAEAVEAGDIKAATITASQIAASTITATQIASETITGAKIAAGTIVASKLSVTELSSITANLGSVTAGTVTGATIRTSASNPKVQMTSAGFAVLDESGSEPLAITTEGMRLFSGEASEFAVPVAPKRIDFRRPTGGTIIGSISSNWGTNTNEIVTLIEHASNKRVKVKAEAKNSIGASHLRVGIGEEESEANTTVTAQAGSSTNFRTIINGKGESSFLQLVAIGKLRMNTGTAEATFGGGSVEATQVITHGLSATPVFAHISPEDSGYVSGTKTYGSSQFTASVQKRDGTSPAAGTKAKFHWIAIG